MDQLDSTRKTLEEAKQQLAEHKKYCDLCLAGLRCSVRAELDQYIRLCESWLEKVKSK